MSKPSASVVAPLRAIPKVLLPRQQAGARPPDWIALVDVGPRHLAARPFNYRNRFPLLRLAGVKAQSPNGAQHRAGSMADGRR